MSLIGTYDWKGGLWRTPLLAAGWANSASGYGVERVVGGLTLRIGTTNPAEATALLGRPSGNLIATLQPSGVLWADATFSTQPQVIDPLCVPTRVRVYDGGAFAVDLAASGSFPDGVLCVEPDGGSVYGLLSFPNPYRNSTLSAYGAPFGYAPGPPIAPGDVGFSATPGSVLNFRRVLAYALPPCGSLVDANTLLIDPPFLVASGSFRLLHTFVNLLPPNPFAGVSIGGRTYDSRGVATV